MRSDTNSPLRMERCSKPQRAQQGCDRLGGYAGVLISSRISVLVATPLGPLGLNAEHENVATTMLRSQPRIGMRSHGVARGFP